MTVAELIRLLEIVQDKSKEVFVFNTNTGNIHDVFSVDLDISDRLDINFSDKEDALND